MNARNEDGSTPLHVAAEAGHKAVAELLIAKGADVNATDKSGATPLQIATQKGHKDIVELLESPEAAEK